MPSKKYALYKGKPERLEISWKLLSPKLIIRLDGKVLGVIPDDKSLADGFSYTSMNGSRLTVRRGGADGEPFDVRLNGKLLLSAGNVGDYSPSRNHVTVGVITFIALVNLFLALTTNRALINSLGVTNETRPFILLTGVIYAVLAFFVWRASLVALVITIIGYVIDSLPLFLPIITEETGGGLGAFFMRAIFLIVMIKGIKPLRELRAEKAREARLLEKIPHSREELWLMLVAAVWIGLIAIAGLAHVLSTVELPTGDGESNTLATLVANIPKPTRTPGPTKTPTPTPTPIIDTPRSLPFSVAFTEYSKALDSVIMASRDPAQLHIYNPETGEDRTVALMGNPDGLALSLDGQFAVVGHPFKVSYIDLTRAEVVKTLNVGQIVSDLAFPSNDWIYIFSSDDNYPRFVEIATNREIIVEEIPSRAFVPILGSADGQIMYMADNDGVLQISVTGTGNPTTPSIDYYGPYSYQSPADLSALSWDERYIFADTGVIYRVSRSLGGDINKVGRFIDSYDSQWKLIERIPTRSIGPDWVVRLKPDGTLFFYATERWTEEVVPPTHIIPYPQMVNLPTIEAGESGYFDVRVNAAGTRYYLIFRKSQTEYGIIARDVPPAIQ